MKKNAENILVVLFSICIMISCKKENAKDSSAAIRDKTWWGEFNYTGRTPEYYSVHFNADKTFTWSQMLGDYAGKWTMNGKQLTMTFIESSLEIKADISDDNQMVNISDNTYASEINSGQLIVNPNESIINKVWKGNYGIRSYQLNFLDGLTMKSKFLDNGFEYSYNYLRSCSGAVIRYGTSPNSTYVFMAVITSANEVRVEDINNVLWIMDKL